MVTGTHLLLIIRNTFEVSQISVKAESIIRQMALLFPELNTKLYNRLIAAKTKTYRSYFLKTFLIYSYKKPYEVLCTVTL